MRLRRCGVWMSSFGRHLLHGVERHFLSMAGDQQTRMLHIAIGRFTVRDDDRRAKRGNTEQKLCKFERQMHAAVTRWVAWKGPGVQRDTTPCQSLRVGHRRIIIE